MWPTMWRMTGTFENKLNVILSNMPTTNDKCTLDNGSVKGRVVQTCLRRMINVHWTMEVSKEELYKHAYDE